MLRKKERFKNIVVGVMIVNTRMVWIQIEMLRQEAGAILKIYFKMMIVNTQNGYGYKDADGMFLE